MYQSTLLLECGPNEHAESGIITPYNKAGTVVPTPLLRKGQNSYLQVYRAGRLHTLDLQSDVVHTFDRQRETGADFGSQHTNTTLSHTFVAQVRFTRRVRIIADNAQQTEELIRRQGMASAQCALTQIKCNPREW